MSFSKKSLDQLKSFKTKKDLFKEENSDSDNSNNINSYSNNVNKHNELFYSIIDNANNLQETTLKNDQLKQSEANLFKHRQDNIKSDDNSNYLINDDIKLSDEELLYDEFNYLLEDE